MQCAEAREQLGAYLDGELDSDWQGTVVRHVEACERCSAELRSLRETIAAVRSLALVEPPAGIPERVHDRIALLSAHGSPLRRLLRLGPVRVAATVAAALVVLIGLGVIRQPAIAPVVTELPRLAPSAPESAGPQPSPVSIGAPPASDPGLFRPSVDLAPVLRRVVKQASLAVETPAFDTALDRAGAVAEGAGGYVERTAAGGDGARAARLVLRVPAGRFDEAVASLEKLGDVVQREITGQDVTDEYVDLRARVRNLQRQEARLLELYTRAGRIQDLLDVEREVGRVRDQIERYQGRMQLLDHQAEMARIELLLRERRRQSALPPWHPAELLRRATEAVAGTLDRIGSFLAFGIITVAAVLPYGMITGAGWLVARRIHRRSRDHGPGIRG